MSEEREEFVIEGRKAEKLYKEEVANNGDVVKVTELWVEPKPEKKLTKRVVEYTRSLVYKREIQNIDELTGQVLDSKTEVVDDPQLKIVEHNIAPVVSFVTREEMEKAIKDAVVTGVKAMQTSVAAPSYREIVATRQDSVNKNATIISVVLWTIIGILSAALAYTIIM